MSLPVKPTVRGTLTVCLLLLASACSTAKKTVSKNRSHERDSLVLALMASNPAYFDSVLVNRHDWNVQIIYTQIDRDSTGMRFTDHYFNVNREAYFYPASSVKFAISMLALQWVHEHERDSIKRYSTMITERSEPWQIRQYNDPNSVDGRPTVAEYIKKILLVSDNEAFNRLYELLGQKYINARLHRMGYRDVQVVHRLGVSLDEKQNRRTNAVVFLDSAGNRIFEKPESISRTKYAQRNTRLGSGFVRDTAVVWQPFDFSRKNRFYLEDLHSIMRSALFPASVTKKHRFNLSQGDDDFIRQYLCMYPREAGMPFYDSTAYSDAYAKMFLPEGVARAGLRIYSKAGWAYGFLTDVAYIRDEQQHIEFMLSASIYCNSDGIFNDDKYDYESVGYPFFRHLSETIFDYERTRPRTAAAQLPR